MTSRMNGKAALQVVTSKEHVVFSRDVRAIYLAGKVSMDHDWREQLVAYHPDYDDMLRDDPGHAHKFRYGGIVFDPEKDIASLDYGRQHWSVRQKAIFGQYDYTGPYVTDLGHGQNLFDPDDDAMRQRVMTDCFDAIKRSDVVFAWLDDITAYATLAELGYARALGKRIWIAAPMEYRDLWFVYRMAERVSFGTPDPETALLAMLARIEHVEDGED